MTNANDPTQPQILAAIIGLAIHMRRLIDQTDQSNPELVATTLSSLHENLAVIGGSAVQLADDLGHKKEVDRLVDANLAKAQAFAACAGVEGRA